jgi:hypothetical protein
VVLDKQPEADVVVPIVNPAPGRLLIDKTSLTFNTVDWNMPQVVTITPINNCLVDGHINHQVVVDFAVSADQAFNGIKGDNVNLLLYNDDPKVYEIDGQYSGEKFTICGFEQIDVFAQTNGNFKYRFATYGKNNSVNNYKSLSIKINEKNFPVVKTTISLYFNGIRSLQTVKDRNVAQFVVSSQMPVTNWINPDWYSLKITSQRVR